MSKRIWVKQFRVDRDEEQGEVIDYELSVVVTSCHGFHSWGWSGPEKIILSRFEDDHPSYILDKLILVADKLVEELNEEEEMLE